MNHNSFIIIKEISHTKYHILYEARNYETGEIVTIKAIDPKWYSSEEIRLSAIKQFELSKQLEHENIVRYVSVFEEGNAIYIVREYVPGRSLGDILKNNSRGLDPDKTITLLLQMASALDYVHAKGIIHKNLNPDSILITPEGDVKLTGFGKPDNAWLTVEMEKGAFHPVYYAAPEVFHGDIPSEASDIYSLGVIAYQCTTSILPWSLNQKESYLQVKQQSLSKPVLNPELFGINLPDWFYCILNKCLMIAPELRFNDISALVEALSTRKKIPFIPATTKAEKPAPEIKPVVHIPELREPEVVQQLPEIPVLEPVPSVIDLETQSTDQFAQTDLFDDTIVTNPEQLYDSELEPETKNAEFVIHPPAEQPYSEGGFGVSQEFIPEKTPVASDTNLVQQSLEEPVVFESHPQYAYDEEIHHSQTPPAQTNQQSNAAQFDYGIAANESIPTPEMNVQSSDAMVSESKAPDTNSHSFERPPKPSIEQAIEQESISKMRKTFILLSVLAVLVIAYTLFTEFWDRPDYSKKTDQTSQSDDKEQTETDPLSSEKIENLPIRLVHVKGDTLVIGSMAPEAKADEFPLKEIGLKDFYIGVYEVTQREWKMVFPSNPSLFKDDYKPVENVSFYEAIEFCNLKSELDNLQPCYEYRDNELFCDFNANGYRLPTEAEWEFAAKEGQRYSPYLYSGTSDFQEAGWFLGNSSAQTQQVGQKKPNKLGVYDLNGNIFEWVWNWYSSYSYRIRDPYRGPDSGSDKVIRGGSWYHSTGDMRNTNRGYAKPFTKSNYIGFRVARTKI